MGEKLRSIFYKLYIDEFTKPFFIFFIQQEHDLYFPSKDTKFAMRNDFDHQGFIGATLIQTYTFMYYALRAFAQ